MPVKKVPQLATIVHRSTVEATANQLRVLAEETREVILDRLFAARPQAPAGATVARPRRIRESPSGFARPPFRHRALTDKHVRKKARQGNDGRKLIETGDYANSIEVFKGQQKASGTYYMVRPAPRPHDGADPSSGPISQAMLARVHEFGSARHGIPARPHWGPAVRFVLARFTEVRRGVRAAVLRAVLREVQ
jgi:hypothetical protein